MKTEITISKKTADILMGVIRKAIEEEMNFPEHEGDEWMITMQEAETALGEADRIVIEG